MKKLKVDHFRELLQEQEANLTTQIHKLQDVNELSQGAELGELSHYDNHPGDVGTDTFTRERDLAIEDNLKHQLETVRQALRRVEDGTYGTCERCSEPIDPARLEFVPASSLCMKCASDVEGQG